MERHQIALGFLGYLFIGTATVLVPTLMPFITNEFSATGLTLATIGLIVPAGAAGGIVGTLLAGVGSDVFGRRRLVWLAALLLAAALALAAGATRWLLFVLGLVLVSVAQGALSTGINAMIADAKRTARARALNLLHGVYGLGAAVSPLIIGSLIDRGLLWRWVMAGTGLLWLTYSVVVHQFYRAERLDAPGSTVQPLNLGMLRERPFLALFLIAFIYSREINVGATERSLYATEYHCATPHAGAAGDPEPELALWSRSDKRRPTPALLLRDRLLCLRANVDLLGERRRAGGVRLPDQLPHHRDG